MRLRRMGRGIRTYIRGYAKDAAQDAAQDVAEDVTQDVAQDEAFGARAARALNATPPPPPLPQSLCSSRLAEMGGATGQPNGIWLGLWARASGGAAQSASMLYLFVHRRVFEELPVQLSKGIIPGGTGGSQLNRRCLKRILRDGNSPPQNPHWLCSW